ncbi:hypothetical protein BDQ12DRAFT_284507 [Crucibulum laeve]|uniref:TEA domain-containing protein n=1 Tax=Crucibulum laeve TaxID=68775 RepID=A0A5C3MDY0_9AGAR|nr:hypothetical protein BDQ12DRAFT_284507 [Crucibulum laeve]
MSPTATHAYLPDSSMKRSDSKSLTPQRKHRKLLKDGSGTEVWPESIEKVFVQGLREYWESPYATYSQSRGRSRWRNQFLVDYLQRAGITRTKKQVASHIQVLRNMWKGEPEFHLVAGGEEIYSESGQTAPVKVEDHWESNHLIPFDYDDSDAPSPQSASPDFSPPDFIADFPPTPEHRPNLYPSDLNTMSGLGAFIPTKSQCSPSSFSPLDLNFSTSGHISNPSGSPYTTALHQLDLPQSRPIVAIPVHNYSPTIASPNSTSSSTTPHSRKPQPTPGRHDPHGHISRTSNVPVTSSYPRFPPNRVTALALTAEGMTPFSVQTDGSHLPFPNQQSPSMIRLKLAIPTVNDMRSSPTLHGFSGSVSLSSVWNICGKCTTKVYAGRMCTSEETGYLDVSHIDVGTVNTVLPESSLNRCRWLDDSVPTTITQEIIVDNETLMTIIYDLDRKNTSFGPSVVLLGLQKSSTQTNVSLSHLSHIPSPTSPQASSNSPYGRNPTSLSHALTPTRYATSNFMTQ